MFNASSSDHARPRHSESTRMRMKCQVVNTLGLYSELSLGCFQTYFVVVHSDLLLLELAQALERMGSSLTLIFSPNSLQIVKWEAQAGGMQVWV